MQGRYSKWTQGYQTMLSCKSDTRQLMIVFANGNRVSVLHRQLVPPGFDQVEWEKATLASDGSHIAIPAQPKALNIGWQVIRSLTDEFFARHMVEIAHEEAIHLGQLIRTLRKSRNLSQGRLASLADIGKPHLSRIETGKTGFSSAIFWKLLAAMEFLPSEFIF